MLNKEQFIKFLKNKDYKEDVDSLADLYMSQQNFIKKQILEVFDPKNIIENQKIDIPNLIILVNQAIDKTNKNEWEESLKAKDNHQLSKTMRNIADQIWIASMKNYLWEEIGAISIDYDLNVFNAFCESATEKSERLLVVFRSYLDLSDTVRNRFSKNRDDYWDDDSLKVIKNILQKSTESSLHQIWRYFLILKEIQDYPGQCEFQCVDAHDASHPFMDGRTIKSSKYSEKTISDIEILEENKNKILDEYIDIETAKGCEVAYALSYGSPMYKRTVATKYYQKKLLDIHSSDHKKKHFHQILKLVISVDAETATSIFNNIKKLLDSINDPVTWSEIEKALKWEINNDDNTEPTNWIAHKEAGKLLALSRYYDGWMKQKAYGSEPLGTARRLVSFGGLQQNGNASQIRKKALDVYKLIADQLTEEAKQDLFEWAETQPLFSQHRNSAIHHFSETKAIQAIRP